MKPSGASASPDSASQSGGASAALRRLVQAAMSEAEGADAGRNRREAAYRVMSALAGDLPGFEDASRALFADDLDRLGHIAARWPADVWNYLSEQLTGGEMTPRSGVRN